MSLASYRTPSGRGNGQAHGDYVHADAKLSSKGSSLPTYKVPGRVLDTINHTSMQDADFTASKLGAKFTKVFGNAAFENEASAAAEPSAVKMGNFFDEVDHRRPSRQVDQHAQQPDSGQLAAEDTVARGPSLMSFFRKTNSPNSTLRADEPLGTIVQAFRDAEELEDRTTPTPPEAPEMSTERILAAWEVELKQLIASNMRDEALHRPAPSQGLIRCYITRSKNLLGTHCSFELYLENGHVFLLAARRRKKSKVSSYVISQDLEDLKRDTENCVAKLKANFVGTEYMLWGKDTTSGDGKTGYASEDACVSYQVSVGKKSGPRIMHAILPNPESGWQPLAPDGTDCLSNNLALAKLRELPPYMERNVTTLCSKAATYCDEAKGFTLDFEGRVREPSVKNFQLVAWDHNTGRQGKDVLLQFGKLDSTTFILDFAFPLSVQTAFGLALSSIDTKLCCAV